MLAQNIFALQASFVIHSANNHRVISETAQEKTSGAEGRTITSRKINLTRNKLMNIFSFLFFMLKNRGKICASENRIIFHPLQECEKSPKTIHFRQRETQSEQTHRKLLFIDVVFYTQQHHLSADITFLSHLNLLLKIHLANLMERNSSYDLVSHFIYVSLTRQMRDREKNSQMNYILKKQQTFNN